MVTTNPVLHVKWLTTEGVIAYWTSVQTAVHKVVSSNTSFKGMSARKDEDNLKKARTSLLCLRLHVHKAFALNK